MRSLNFTLGAGLLPSFSLVSGLSAKMEDCYGKICHAIEEYCSTFSEGCARCVEICEPTTHNFQADLCAKHCAEYNSYEPLKAEINTIQQQLRVTLILLIVLLCLVVVRYAYKCVRWLRNKRCLTTLLKRLQPKKYGTAGGQQMGNGKELGATTIQNVMTINDIERASSPIYSVTGAEGSVVTVTTPVSTRYPAENSTTPTTEYSYDNQALSVTPVTEKPTAKHGF